MDPSLELFLIALMMVFSSIYAGMEAAFYSQSEIKLRARKDAGEELPRMLQLWLDRPYDLLTTLLIGNNLVNIAASALATDLTHQALLGTAAEGWGIPIAVGITTIVVLIVGEVAPKTLAKANPDRFFSFFPLLLIRVSYSLFYPGMKVLVWLAEKMLSGIGESSTAELSHQIVTEEDIEELVRIGSKDGSIDHEASRLLQGVLDLGDKVAREVMVPRTEIQAFDVQTSVEEVLTQASEAGNSRYPIYEDAIDQIVGVLYVKDLLPDMLTGSHTGRTLSEYMRKPIIRPENMSLEALLLEMKRKRVHMVILASEYGGVEGLVTLEDIVEEVFGEIYDEHDTDPAAIRPLPDGSWVVDGVATIHDLEQEIGLALSDDDEDYETITGFLMKVAQTMPERGFTHKCDGWAFEVLASDRTRVTEVAVRRLVVDDDGEESARGEVASPTLQADF